jgi:ADP-heptose:LPS heptosyltransferase
MTRTLVIQLGRLGDVIQTTPLLADLAARGDEIDVLVLHSVHTALLGCPAVANIVTISDALKPLDDAIAFGFPHRKIPALAFDLLADLRLPLYDRAINASHAPLGCWLAAEIPCADPSARYGGIIRAGECLYFGTASAYRIAMLQFREQNLFNLVDLIHAIPGIPTQDAQPCLYANQSPELPFALPRGRKVALNPGASEAVRCWPAENFARLAEALSAAGFVPLLVGAPSDRDLCERIAAAAYVAIPNFAGRTTIPEMAALLARCELLISADTGAAHLAAAVGTTVVGLYGAAAWFAETAPYGNNHLILQTPLNAPMSSISLDSVLAAALNRLNRLSATDFGRELRAQNQSVWETSIRCPDSIDPLGGLLFRPLHRDSLTPDELFAQSLRRAFAMDFVLPIKTGALNHPVSLATESAPQTGSAGILAGSDATQIDRSTTYRCCEPKSLQQIFDHMQTLATLCDQSTRSRSSSTAVEVAACALITTMEKLRALAAVPSWRPFSPLIHFLDWQLRMLPQQSPEQTFRSHEQAYVSAARILHRSISESCFIDDPPARHPERSEGSQREPQRPLRLDARRFMPVASAAEMQSVADEKNKWKGTKTSGGREGGQVPHSVRIQAPARQRGSVSP